MAEPNQNVKRAFENASKKFSFRGIELCNAFELPELTIIACSGKIGQLIGKKGTVIAELSRELNKKIRVVEHSSNAKKVVSDLIGNARLVGVNEVFSPIEKSINVFVNRNDREKLVAKPEALEKAAEEILRMRTRFEFV